MDAFNNLKNKITGKDEKDKKQNEEEKKDDVGSDKQQDENEPLAKKKEGGLSRQIVVTNFIASAGDKIREQKDSLVEKATTSFSQLDSKLRDMLKEYSFKINKWARYKIMEFVLMFIEKQRQTAKNAVHDPDMCDCVKNLVDDVIDDLWPEIMDEVKYQLMMGVDDPYVQVPQRKIIACLYPFYYIRSQYLYSIDPYNRTIWKQFKTVSWWFWTLISSIPLYGISQFFYVFDFLMRDKEDQFQLSQFILRFKTMYFITQGVMKAVIGYFMLYACSTMIEKNKTDPEDKISELETCRREGPGASLEVFSELVGFFCQIFFIWFAFVLLPFSKQKGRPLFKYEDERPPDTGCCPRAGRLKYFMLYDGIIFCLSVGLFFMVWAMQDQEDIDNSGDFIFFAQVCYGLLSFPFLVFNIPVIKDRLTQAKVTAYDRKGNCIPKMKEIKIVEEKNEDKSLLSSFSLDVEEVFAG